MRSCYELREHAARCRMVCPALAGRQFVVFSDVGNGEKDARKAAAVCGGRLELPAFAGELLEAFKERTGTDKDPTDWNDYYVATGELP